MSRHAFGRFWNYSEAFHYASLRLRHSPDIDQMLWPQQGETHAVLLVRLPIRSCAPMRAHSGATAGQGKAGYSAPRCVRMLAMSALVFGALWSGLGMEQAGRPVTAQQEAVYGPHRPS
jgi:hypothetical protein